MPPSGRKLNRVLKPVTAAAALAVALAACGSDAPGSGEGGQAEATRSIQTAMGPVDIPTAPQRVVVLDIGELDSLLTVGVEPVGAVRASTTETFPEYLKGAEGIPIVGTIGEPDLEAIDALDPDLILSSKSRDEDRYDELSRIAPTVLAERVGGVWRENFLLNADAVGKKAEADQYLAAFDQRAAAIGSSIGDPAAITVSMLRFTETEIRAYCETSFIGSILAKVGLGRPASQTSSSPCPSANGSWTEQSAERLADADGDWLFWSTFGAPEDSLEPETTGSALWGNLGAVRDGKAVRVEDEYWFTGVGPSAAGRVLDDLERMLAA